MNTPVFDTTGDKLHEHLPGLMDLLPAAVCVYDADGRLRQCNSQALQLWGQVSTAGNGKEREAFSISQVFYYSTGQAMPPAETPIAICLATGQPQKDVEVLIQRPDRSCRSVMMSATPIRSQDGHVTGVVCLMVDVTGALTYQKQTQDIESRLAYTVHKKEIADHLADLTIKNEALKRSEERYHKMIEEVEDYAILLLDRNGYIQNWNKGAQKIKGYEEKEIVGKHFRIFYRPEDREIKLPESLMAEAFNKGKAAHEGWRLRKDGTIFWGSIVITALHNDDNNVIGFSKVTRDLTEKKLTEDKIRQYASDLEFQNRELEQFAYAAAHDMKEPLRKVQYYNNYIVEHAGAHLPQKEKDYLNRSVAAATRMQTLIDDLLTYSQTSSHAQSTELVNLEKIFTDVVLLHHDTIQETGAIIEHERLPYIQGIAFQLTQLFDNLIGNSLKYHHPNRVPHIKVSVEKVHGASIQDSQASELALFHKISFADNGIGFDSHHSAQIFGLFQRLHDRAQYSGTGIGLAICKKIAQNHQGFLTAHGERDKGATFNVYLPIQ
jgi:PAS domain S-box-containing protein